jgi:hypothetical protein
MAGIKREELGKSVPSPQLDVKLKVERRSALAKGGGAP